MVYLIAGQNSHFKKAWLQAFKLKHSGYSFIAFDGDDGDKTNVSSIDSSFSQVSLFDSPKKVLHIKNWMRSDLSEYLQEKVADIVKSNDIVLILDSNDPIRSNAKIRKIIDAGNIIITQPYTTNELSGIVSKYLKDGKVKEWAYAHKLIMEKVDKDPFMLEAECSKLITLNNLRPLTKTDISDCIIPSVTFSIWEYIKLATSGKVGKAMEVLNELLDKGENEYAVLGLIQWNIKLITVVLSANNRTDNSLIKDFGYSPYSIKPAREILSRYSIKKMVLIYQKVIELEEKMKAGKIEPKLGLLLLTMVF